MLELTTAALSINMLKLIRNELEISEKSAREKVRYFEEKSWTNIGVVLGYIKNQVKWFKILLQIEFR